MSHAPKAILKTTDLIPSVGPLRGNFGTQIVRLQSDDGGEFINEQLTTGCQTRGVCMTRIPPYQPWSNGLIERMVGLVREHLREVRHAA
eukprot:2145368-Prorocentrum_lima.AAC.1